MSDESLQIGTIALQSQERFVYFITTGDAAAIAFALVRTEGQLPALWMIPVALAVAIWALSFLAGCHFILTRQRVLLANFEMLKLGEGTHPLATTRPDLVGAAEAALKQKRDEFANENKLNGRLQYWSFVAGMLCFAGGHVWRIFSAGGACCH